jgi:DNA (cytosine-5)-methyltransferase 1
MSRRRILVADLLCGAGGSSTGCTRALRELGLEMELVCVNHWPVAIETHRKNHPEARHYVQDISAVRPHLVVPEGYLDLLMASPYLDSLAKDYLDSGGDSGIFLMHAFGAILPQREG